MASAFPIACALLLPPLVAGCGLLARSGGGDSDLPVSGAGPYKRLAADEATPWDEPVLLSDGLAALDDPLALAEGEAIGLWYSRRDAKGGARIEHVDLARLEAAPSDPQVALEPGPAWEGGRIVEPALLAPARPGGKWLLFYAARGGLGYALSDDGHTWTRAPGPVLVATADEGSLASPALLRLGPDRVRLLYLTRRGIEAADARQSDLANLAPEPLVRRSGPPLVAPGAASWLPLLGRFTARSQTLSTGRVRHDLFLTGRAVDGLRLVGFAASFDGLGFAVAPEPMVDVRAPEESAPSGIAYRAGSLLFFTQPYGQRSTIAVARSP